MYSACIFCNEPLGTNDQIEHFPIGRRLAFDSAKGRLWIVCRRCSQWNLTPIEERWEAVEDCERAYRSVRTRVSTSEIGLARLPDGLDLVRIGAPLRPEFAAWRFGDQFGVRQRRGILSAVGLGGAVVTAGAGILVAAPTAGLLVPLVGLGAAFAATGIANASAARPFTKPLRLTADDGSAVALGSQAVVDVQMRADAGPVGFHLAMDVIEEDPWGWGFRPKKETVRHVVVSGMDAVRAARLLLPRINGFGATKRVVGEAVSAIEDVGSVDRFIPYAMSIVRKSGLAYSKISAYPTALRLGIEMVLHEEAERRAMAGELADLTAAWRQAEQIAGISDDLLLPKHVAVFLDKHRRR